LIEMSQALPTHWRQQKPAGDEPAGCGLIQRLAPGHAAPQVSFRRSANVVRYPTAVRKLCQQSHVSGDESPRDSNRYDNVLGLILYDAAIVL
jgi:hypothetical protein